MRQSAQNASKERADLQKQIEELKLENIELESSATLNDLYTKTRLEKTELIISYLDTVIEELYGVDKTLNLTKKAVEIGNKLKLAEENKNNKAADFWS